ncbi:MAG: hypothetical protein H6552_04380 [Chitinophagales bacterium]|nr:hypothetical protein [Chitinophagales bacterium]
MSVLKYFLHPTLNNPAHEDYRKASIFVYTSFVTCLFLIIYNIYFLFFEWDNTLKIITNLVGTLTFVLGFVYFKYSDNLKKSLSIFMIMCYPSSLISIYHTGGIFSADIIWVALLIVSAYLFINITIGSIISAISIIYLTILYFMDTYGNPAFKNYIIENSSTHNIFTFGFVILLMSSLLISFNKVLQRTNQKLETLKQEQIEELQEKIKEKTEELNLLRKDLAKDFHDEMGNKLASITILSQSIGLKMDIGKSEAEIKKLLNTIEERSIELYHGTKDFIWSIDFKSDYIDEWFIYTRDFGEDFFEKLGISFYSSSDIKQDSNLTFDTNVSRQLIYILKEIMTNTAKHSNATQTNLQLLLLQETNEIDIVFSDNGNGFNIENIQQRGINNIRERIAKINGKLDINSDKTTGSVFKIRLPLQHNYKL